MLKPRGGVRPLRLIQEFLPSLETSQDTSNGEAMRGHTTVRPQLQTMLDMATSPGCGHGKHLDFLERVEHL